MTDVAIDLGKTTCRLRTSTRPWRDRRGVGAPGLASDDGATAAVAAVLELLQTVPDRPQDGWGHLSIGAAGALAAPAAAAECAERILLASGAHEVAITSDAVIAHLGAFEGGAGVVVIAGTGAVAIGIDHTGAVVVGDGAGPERGDLGSGAWIGLTALREAVQGATALAARALTRYGPEWPGLAADGKFYEFARSRGEFVMDVAVLARAGDEVSTRIVTAAAAQLAATARSTADRLSWPDAPPPVALLGGLTGLGGLLSTPLGEAVRPARLVQPRGDALDGADLLIRRHDLPHEALVTRRERS